MTRNTIKEMKLAKKHVSRAAVNRAIYKAITVAASSQITVPTKTPFN